MIPKEFDAISKEDIDALPANAVPESRTIEYKEQLPGGSDEDKKEFLADASSLANAGGGDLIFGISEKRDANGKPTGLPEAAEGLAGANPDAEKRRFEDMLRAGIDPRIPGIRIKHIDGFPAGPVLIIRIPKSWASPHMVIFKNLSRFYTRTSAGKHQLDVREIRAVFNASESLTTRISAFRSDRVGKILAGEAPLVLAPTPKVVVHLLPITAFTEPGTFDIKSIQALAHGELYLMGPSDGQRPRFNFDGYIIYDENRERNPSPAYTYLQIFRNGIIEAVWTDFVRAKDLLIGPLERELTRGVSRYLKLQQKLGLEPPVFVTISLVGVKESVILTRDQANNRFLSKPIDRDVLLTPEILIEESAANTDSLLRPALDTIWQASGWPCSQGYDENGKRVGSLNYDY